jgi:hypothetical protein
MDMTRILPRPARGILGVPLRITAGLLLVAQCIVHGPAPAFATTGPSNPAAPTYRVPLNQAKSYCGHYTLRRASRAAHFTGGAMAIALNAQGVLVGVLQVYGKDARHFTMSWVATLYNFHLLTKGHMAVEILGGGYRIRLGRLMLTRSGAGDLSGRISLGAQGYAIQWHRLALSTPSVGAVQ